MKPRKPISRKKPLKRGKPLSRRPKTPRKKLKAECDRLFSRFIRLRDGRCRLSGSPPDCRGSLQCAHLFSRRYFATRWDPLNAWGLCAAHHVFYTHRPLEWDELIRRETAYEHLRRTALSQPMPALEPTLETLKYLVRKYEALAC